MASFRAAVTTVAVVAMAIVTMSIVDSQAAPENNVTFVAEDDAYISKSRPGVNFGSEQRLVAGTAFGDTKTTYLRFVVRDLPPGTQAGKAAIQLTRDEHHLPPRVDLLRVPDTNWSEQKITFNNAPPIGALLTSVSTTPQTNTVTFDVSQIVKGPGVYAFAVRSPAVDDVARFRSSEYPDSKPSLRITLVGQGAGQVPTPAVVNPMTSPSLPPFPAFPWVPSFPWASPGATPSPSPQAPSPSLSPTVAPQSPSPTAQSPSPSPQAPTPTPSQSPSTSPSPSPSTGPQECTVGANLVPTCGILWGAAAGGHTTQPPDQALRDFETKTERRQNIFHVYHRGTDVFPTRSEIAMARDPGGKRLLFINYNPNPLGVSWADIAAGNAVVNAQLDRIAANIVATFPERFFFTVLHEPEDDVRAAKGSGYTAKDYAAMYRYVIERLRAHGVTNAVTVMDYMSYPPWNTQSWFSDLYPGDDVVDWIAWNVYGYSTPGGFGYGDFAEMMNRPAYKVPSWPGMYNWAAAQFPDKPLMVGEWGVWYSGNDSDHQAEVYKSVGEQIGMFSRIKAMVYYETPNDLAGNGTRGWDDRPDASATGLAAYRELGRLPIFQVRLPAE